MSDIYFTICKQNGEKDHSNELNKASCTKWCYDFLAGKGKLKSYQIQVPIHYNFRFGSITKIFSRIQNEVFSLMMTSFNGEFSLVANKKKVVCNLQFIYYSFIAALCWSPIVENIYLHIVDHIYELMGCLCLLQIMQTFWLLHCPLFQSRTVPVRNERRHFSTVTNVVLFRLGVVSDGLATAV